MQYEDVAEAVRGIPHMTPEQGRAVYDHVVRTKPQQVLEIGTANGVSTSYIAAALKLNGTGRITTVDRVDAAYEPGPYDTLRRVGLGDLVDLVRIADSSYTWYLKDVVRSQSDAEGNCRALYDFVFLDGAHNWTIDGLAVVLIEKLLGTDGWLLLDDLSWTYEAAGHPEEYGLSAAERSEPHVGLIYDLIVKQSPSFTEFRAQADLDFGWARKAPGEARRLSLETSASVSAALLARVRRARMRRR